MILMASFVRHMIQRLKIHVTINFESRCNMEIFSWQWENPWVMDDSSMECHVLWALDRRRHTIYENCSANSFWCFLISFMLTFLWCYRHVKSPTNRSSRYRYSPCLRRIEKVFPPFGKSMNLYLNDICLKTMGKLFTVSDMKFQLQSPLLNKKGTFFFQHTLFKMMF